MISWINSVRFAEDIKSLSDLIVPPGLECSHIEFIEQGNVWIPSAIIVALVQNLITQTLGKAVEGVQRLSKLVQNHKIRLGTYVDVAEIDRAVSMHLLLKGC